MPDQPDHHEQHCKADEAIDALEAYLETVEVRSIPGSYRPVVIRVDDRDN
jgi:hypothetical protein